uniref:Uncharacterized protein n=1 Tax=Anguilla anguilla TaxID=7936 RepID=A0A0E9T7L1_ANGAN
MKTWKLIAAHRCTAVPVLSFLRPLGHNSLTWEGSQHLQPI